MYEIVVGRSDSDRKELGLQGSVFLGKHYVRMGQTTSLSNKIYLDVAKTHVVLVSGKRGSGKSYTLGVVAEEMAHLPPEVKNKIAVLMIDTMGIFWTMRFPNAKDEDLLEEWGLPKKPLDINIYTPAGYFQEYKDKGIPADFPFTISPSELSTLDWCNSFEIKINEPIGVAIESTLSKLQEENTKYSVDEIIEAIEKNKKIDDVTRLATVNRFIAAKSWGIFSEESTPLKEIVSAGKVSVLDISAYKEWNVKTLVTGIICKKLMEERVVARKKEEMEDIRRGHSYFQTTVEKTGEELPLIWILIDECVSGDTKIITNEGILEIRDIINKVENNKKIEVLSFNNKNQKYEYKEITKGYRIKQRELIKIETETGDIIKCTPDHPILSKSGYISGINAKDIAKPLKYFNINDSKLIISRLLGHIFGDGYLSHGKIIGFTGKGNKEDLNLIKEDLANIGFSSTNIYSRMTISSIKDEFGKESKVIGLSEEVRSNRKTWNFFKDLGASIGKKALNSTKIPNWIMDASIEEKQEFLAAWMGSDGYGLSKSKNSKLDFNAVRLSFNKIEKLEKESWELATQICKLFNDVGIKISSIKKKSGNIRKDGNKTIKILITLSKSIDNTILFLERIGFRYCAKKEIQGKKILAYLKAYKIKTEEIKNLIKKTKELEVNYNINEIAIKLGVQSKKIRMWSKQNIKGISTWDFPSFEEWISERIIKEILYEKIRNITVINAEELFDLSVRDNHNFIANEFIVHNCHEFLPKEGTTAATDALVTILREGRQPGISLILATQQPGEIHKDVITQTDIILSHRITAKRDLEALNSMMQSYLPGAIQKYFNLLPKLRGSAIILDDNSERIYPLQIRPRFTWHGGEAPTAIKAKGKAASQLGL